MRDRKLQSSASYLSIIQIPKRTRFHTRPELQNIHRTRWENTKYRNDTNATRQGATSSEGPIIKSEDYFVHHLYKLHYFTFLFNISCQEQRQLKKQQ